MSEIATHEMERAALNGLALEYELRGSGEPVVLIHWGICAAWAEPLMDEPALADRYRVLSYHRAGFAGSDRIEGPLSLAEHAAHCALPHAPSGDRAGAPRGPLLKRRHRAAAGARLSRRRAHARAHGAGAARPADGGAGEFVRDFVAPAMQRYRAGDRAGAVDTFARGVFGCGLPRPAGAGTPGSLRAGHRRRRRVLRPGTARPAAVVVHAGGREPRHAAHARRPRREHRPDLPRAAAAAVSWLPNAEPFELPDATHLLHLQNPRGMADALASFYSGTRSQHPSPSAAAASCSPLASPQDPTSTQCARRFRLVESPGAMARQGAIKILAR